MTAPTISDASILGRKSGATKVAIITLDQRLTYSVTTWGDTAANCRAMDEASDHFSNVGKMA